MQNSPTASWPIDFLFAKITIPIASILTTIWTETDEVDVAVAIVIVDAEEKRIVDVVRVLALACCTQGCTDLIKIIAWEMINWMSRLMSRRHTFSKKARPAII